MKKLLKIIGRVLAAGWNTLNFFRRLALNIAFLALILLLVAVFFSGKRSKLPESAVLVLAPAGTIVEQRSESLLPGELMGEEAPAETALQDMIEALDRAAQDARIKAVLLDTSKLHRAGLSKLQDLGAAVKRFRESGKPVIAAADHYIQGTYFLAAHADRVYLGPMGAVLLTGFGIYQNYYKSALDKLRVQLHVFRVGSYKSALEPFMRDNMSAFDREANSALLEALWSAYKSGVADQRGIDAAAVDDYVNHFPTRLAAAQGDTAQLAMAYGLVDAVRTRDQVRDELIQLAGEDRTKHTFRQIRFDEYVRASEPTRTQGGPADPKVAVIVAQGLILDGVQPAGRIGGSSLSALIRQAAKDNAIRAIVLRIDSPGGSAFASETIRRELELARAAGKPVVVSMGSVAASGGYWISAAADEIWASAATVTGSIGIFSAFPTFERSLEALGVYNDGVGSSRMADAFNPSRPMNALMAEALNQIMETSYRNFISRVAEGRKMSSEAVERVAEGRIWAGQAAVEAGLVDKLGGLGDAVEAAARRAGIEKGYAIDYLQQPLTRRERLLRQVNELFTQVAGISFRAGAPPSAAIMKLVADGPLEDLMQVNDPMGILAYCLVCSSL